MSKFHSIFLEEHLARNFSLEKVFKFIKVLRASVERFLAGLSKLLSIHSKEFFAENVCFNSYRFKAFLRAAVEKFSEVFWKLLSHFPEEGIRRNFLFEETYKTLIFFGLRKKNLSAGLSNSIQIFKKNSLRGNFWSKKM